jgi:hypothetical protein
MAAHVNLDALIPREDFEVRSEGIEAPTKANLQVNDLELGQFFYSALRKPDFQRETAEWDAKRVVGLIRTFIEGDLIPGVILWRNRELLFVIDGSHRLSALMAWVQDDYGDGDRSQKFFGYNIPEEQMTAAKRTRALVEQEFGRYQDHKNANVNPEAHSPEVVKRARRFGSLALELQWVKGDFAKAEESFIRINQQAAMIQPQELELLRNRKKPNAIAARAIIRRGTGHKYWFAFDDVRQNDIEDLAKEIHHLLFEPPPRYPITSLELPIGGPETAAPALRMVYDFINLCVQTPSKDDDPTGERTVEYLTRCRRVMRLLSSKDRSSLGLHPAVYFYSWTGKQMPVLFLVVAELVIQLDRERRLPHFTRVRAEFEAFLIRNKTLLNQVVRKFGTKSSGNVHVSQYYRDILELLEQGVAVDDLTNRLMERSDYNYLQPEESIHVGSSTRGFSSQVKSGKVMGELLQSAPRCPICGGLISSRAVSLDHIERLADGGTSTAANAQMTHPYCNSGYKEMQVSQERSARR